MQLEYACHFIWIPLWSLQRLVFPSFQLVSGVIGCVAGISGWSQMLSLAIMKCGVGHKRSGCLPPVHAGMAHQSVTSDLTLAGNQNATTFSPVPVCHRTCGRGKSQATLSLCVNCQPLLDFGQKWWGKYKTQVVSIYIH